MTTEQTTSETPCIFGARGELVELTDEQAMQLSEEAYALYQNVSDAYGKVLTLDKQVDNCETELRSGVALLREAEEAVRSIPKPSRIDEVRRTLMAQTAGRR